MSDSIERGVEPQAEPGTDRKRDAARAAAEDELFWFFVESSAAIGFCGGMGDGSGYRSWDEQRIASLHDKLNSSAHRSVASKLRRIGPCVEAMTPDDRDVARLALSPRSLPPEVRFAFTLPHRPTICLAALVAARSPSATALRARRKPDEAQPDSMAQFLEWECRGSAETKRLPERLLRMRGEAEALFDAALDRYSELRFARIRWARAAKDAAADIARQKTEPPPMSHEERIAALDALLDRLHGSGA